MNTIRSSSRAWLAKAIKAMGSSLSYKSGLAIVAVIASFGPTPDNLSADNIVAGNSAHRGGGRVLLIVIDPGHGGVDNGASSRSGVDEKNIVLKIARQLKIDLERNLRARVILTRHGDYYISLDERTALANDLRADLFLSIHANGHTGPDRQGVETYFLSQDASDDDARRVAMNENLGLAFPTKNSRSAGELGFMLRDMAQTEAIKHSEQLAIAIQNQLASRTSFKNRGVKQAPFWVLHYAAMPAVLIEVGFMSHPVEGRKLALASQQKVIAKAIAEGISDYQKARRHSIQIPASLKTNPNSTTKPTLISTSNHGVN